MTNADVARLAVQLDLTGNFTSALGAAEQKVGSFSTNVAGRASGAFGTLERAAGRVGGALGHAGNQIKNLITGPLGLIGLTGGLLSFGGAIGATLSKLNDLAFGTEKLAAITGDSAASLSTLIAVTEKYGISVDKLSVISGFYEKTAGKLNQALEASAAVGKSAALQQLEMEKNQRVADGLSTKKINKLIAEQKARDALTLAEAGATAGVSKLMALQAQYGVTLVDSSGKAVSFNTALLNVADAYAKATDKAKAADLAATLFGRSWQTLAPILQLGRQGIIDLETEAAKMGLQLSEGNIADFAKYREAIRNSQEAISGLEVAIGLDLLPTITDLADALQHFVSGHKTDIVAFFHNAVQAAKNVAGTISGLAGTIGAFWSSIPAGVRDLLVKGFVADRTIKFLFGFDPAGAALGGLKNALVTGLAGGLGKSLATAGIGKLFVQPVFVTNPGFGLPGALGGAAGAAEGAGGLGLVAASVGLAVAAGVVVAGGEILRRVINPNSSGDFIQQRAPNAYQAEYRGIFAAVSAANATRREDLAAIKDSDTGLASIYADRRETLAAIKGSTDGLVAAFTRTPDWLKRWEASLHPLNALSKTIHGSIASLLAGRNVGGSAAFLAAHLGIGGVGAGGLPQAQAALGALRSLLAGATGGNRSAILDAIHKIESRLPRLEDNAKNLRLADQIARSSETQKQKLADLDTVMKDVRAHGDKTTQTRIQHLIEAVRHQKPPIVNLTVNTTTRIAPTGVISGVTSYTTYRMSTLNTVRGPN